MNQSVLMTIGEAADEIRVDRASIYRLIDRNVIPQDALRRIPTFRGVRIVREKFLALIDSFGTEE